ncbi:MAG: hypothetical protein JWO82_3732 [Akkermansiaceae bacterium]|nr:hypothetical protein [Akkermansiaceae bacterium]
MRATPATQRSVLLTLGILGLGLLLNGPGRAGLAKLRSERAAVLAKEDRFTALAGEAPPERSHRSNTGARPRRTESNATGRQLARDLLAASRESGQAGLSPEAGREARERALILQDTMADLDVDGLRAFLAEVQRSGDLSNEKTLTLISEALQQLSGKNPELALDLMLRGGPGMTRQILASTVPLAIRYWAQRSPEKTATWLDAAMAANPDFLSKARLTEMARNLADQDPAAMLTTFANQLSPAEKVDAVARRVYSQYSPEDFKTVHDYVFSVPETAGRDKLVGSFYNSVMSGMTTGQFDEMSAWIGQTQPGKQELGAILQALSPPSLGQDAGKWLAWIDQQTPLREMPESFKAVMSHWAYNTPHEAVEWALQNPDPATRDQALANISDTITTYGAADERAGKIALALPEGELRTAAFRKIYDLMPGDTAEAVEAKAAFGEEHRLR